MSEMWYKLALLTLFAVLRIHVVRGYFSCNFESTVDPLCSCYQDTSDNFDWKLDTANPQRSFTRPMIDHTYANRSGHYVFIESSFPAQGSGRVSRFMSPTVFAQNSDSGSNQCLRFHYHMHGPPSQNFHVFIRQHGQAIPEFSHWNRSGDLGDVWHRQMLNMTVSGGFQIIFEGTKGSVYHGDIALDDISIDEGSCEQENTSTPTTGPTTQPSTQVLYEFECHLDNSNLCGFTHDPRNAFNWQWRGNTALPPLGPLGDHTSGSTLGSYMFVSTDSANQNEEQRSRIISPLIARNTVHKCLRFFKFLNGNNVGQLNAYILVDHLTLPLVPNWFHNTSLGHIWEPGFMDIPPQQSNYRIVFEVVRGADYDATVAIDDLVLSNDLCPTINASIDFESGLQEFIQDDTDDANWLLKSGRTWSSYTGPSNDHTYGNTSGHFLYIENTYWGGKEGHEARLLSPVLLATTGYPRCLTFWYHMFGADVEALNIYMVNKTSSDKRDLLWSRSGNRGNKWRAAEVHLESTVDFQVVFEAQQDEGYKGDIAIDDIKIEADVCPGEHHYHNYSSITCDFEEPEICYYEQDKSDSTDWVWVNGDSGGLNTGPSTDHTTKNELGFYLFISYDNTYRYWRFNTQKLTARLISPYAKPQKLPSCVEFWYYMYGRDSENLKVYIQEENEDIPSEASWTKSGDQGNFWHRATIDINMINTRFRIIFEGTTGTNSRDTIAIDDVTFYNSSSCPIFTTEPPPPVTMPSTRDNATCNFEDMYMCNYTQIVEDDYDWSRRQGHRFWWWIYYGYTWTGPQNDHTLGTDKGYYMNFDCDYWWVKYDHRAQLATPYLATHSKPRCLHFHYYMFGYGVDFFNLYIVPFGYTLTVDPTMAIYGNKGEAWQHGTLDLPPSSLPYRVFFEATRGRYDHCDIAIDDISFTEGACTNVKPTLAPLTAGNCDFEPTEDPLCGYTQNNKYLIGVRNWRYDDFDWDLNAGNTSTAKTGPTTDHTLGTVEGHYLYIEASLPKRPLERARIISPIIEGSKEKMCVQFYYHMRGDGIGKLKLILKSENNDETVLYESWGEQGTGWQAEMVELEYARQFQLVFVGSIGMVPSGDIAIDDITILRQPCQGHLKESICTFDVAGDWCGYTQSSEADMEWEWYDTNNVRGNPPIEYKGDGSYIYVTTPAAVQTNEQGRIAQIESRPIDGHSSQHCVEFDFYLSPNSSSSKLTIAVIRNDGKQYNIMTILSHQGTEGWTNMRKTLKKEDVGEKFQVVYIAVIGKDFGVIGLDNPTVSLGSCEEDETSSSSSPQNKTSGNNSPVAIFSGILSTVLIIVLVSTATLYLYRKYKGALPDFSVKYKVHHENGTDNDKNSVPKHLTIDNPLYVSGPAVLASEIINETDTNGVL